MISGGADKAARAFDLQTQQATQIGAHDAPISCIKMVEVSGQQLCLTGSWDKVSEGWLGCVHVGWVTNLAGVVVAELEVLERRNAFAASGRDCTATGKVLWWVNTYLIELQAA